MVTRILQVSDFHVLADPDGRLKGIPTRESLIDVLDLIRAEFSDAEYFLFTGDVVSDEQEASYQHVRQLWGDLLPRCRMIPGNHDDQATMRRVFPDLVSGDLQFVTFSLGVAGWRLIGLDSRVAGEVFGRIAAEQLNWLERQLQAYSSEPTLLFVHHPPISVKSPWLDRLMLQEAELFAEVVRAAPQVLAIFNGHIHHEFTGRLGNIPVFSTPSTSTQFVPCTEVPEFDNVPSGFRVIDLNGDSFETRVVRLAEVKYPAGADA